MDCHYFMTSVRGAVHLRQLTHYRRRSQSTGFRRLMWGSHIQTLPQRFPTISEKSWLRGPIPDTSHFAGARAAHAISLPFIETELALYHLLHGVYGALIGHHECTLQCQKCDSCGATRMSALASGAHFEIDRLRLKFRNCIGRSETKTRLARTARFVQRLSFYAASRQQTRDTPSVASGGTTWAAQGGTALSSRHLYR
ncbi:unnamed protein product [Rangifer tarandus platyrhynchus]|uniref:Uncharacterized protein n=1 Tax=Rangifer tarandus platyrhynchus TaxID=3082113 RepID=A0ABN8XMG7_RANTA|nr:unnamed protein product [Rangifer tarandus platyrhynchus]